MADHSDEFLSPEDERNTHRRINRARSGGYVDHAEDRARWNRRYHAQPASNHLSVPTFDSGHGHRRVRSHDEIRRRRVASTDSPHQHYEPVSSYNVREARPQMAEHDLRKEARRYMERVRREADPQVRSSETTHQRRPSRPKIKVQVHQQHSPESRPDRNTPRRSPNRSPRTPRTPRSAKSARSHDPSPRSSKSTGSLPVLPFYFASVQRKLEAVIAACEPHSDIEAATPRDLTFAKIADEVEGCAFQLRSWSQTVDLNDMIKIDRSKRDHMDLTTRTLERLENRADKLRDACRMAKPQDLKWKPLPDDVDDEGSYNSNVENLDRLGDVTDSLGFKIHSLLDSLRSQTHILFRMTRSLQEATPNARDEVTVVEKLVKDTACRFPARGILSLDRNEDVFAS